jgi:hypothetical protein
LIAVAVEADPRQLHHGLPEGLLPLHADGLQLRVLGVEAAMARDLELVALVDDEIDRRPDGRVGSDSF